MKLRYNDHVVPDKTCIELGEIEIKGTFDDVYPTNDLLTDIIDNAE